MTILIVLILGCLFFLLSLGRQRTQVYYFIPKSIDSDFQFWQTVMDGAKTASDELGIEVHYRGPTYETDVDEQIRILYEVMEEEPSAIILSPADQEALVAVCEAIMKKGITLVLIDSDVSIEANKSLIQTDNIAAAKIIAEDLAKGMGYKGKVAIFSHVEGTSTAIQREEGFRKQMELYDDIFVLDETFYSDGEELKAYEKTLKFLDRYPQVDAIFATNEKTAMGVGKALKELHLQDDIIFVGFDAEATQVQYIEEGTMYASMVQKPFNMGYLGVKEAYAINVEGKEPEVIDTGCALIKEENLFTPENQKLLFPFVE